MSSGITIKDDWFVERAGLPRPDWSRIGAAMREFPEHAAGEAYQAVTREWLFRLANALGGGMGLAESAHFQLLAFTHPLSSEETLTHLEQSRAKAIRILGGLSWKTGIGKHIFMRFRTGADYRKYLGDFVPPDSLDLSGGICLSQGYVHVAWPAAMDVQTDKAIMAHELFHNLVAHLPIPLWLNEGLAMLLELMTTGLGGHFKDAMLIDDHRQWWTGERIQTFWDGSAFADRYSQELAYSLARLLMARLREEIGPSPDAFRRFVATANHADAGAEQFLKAFGVSLGDLAAKILGPGKWEPLTTGVTIPSDIVQEDSLSQWAGTVPNEELFAQLRSIKIVSASVPEAAAPRLGTFDNPAGSV